MKKTANPNIIYLRLFVQVLSLTISALVLVLIILGSKAAIHAICPYSTICFGLSKAGLYSWGIGLFWASVALSIAILIYSIFWGRKFCGYVCPLGTLQEFAYGFHKRKYRTKHIVPYFYEKRFAYVKYVVLAVTSVLTVLGVSYIFIRLCPIYAMSQLPRLALPGLGILLLIVVAGIFMERFWCRYLCPYAALMNLFQYIGKVFGIKRRKIHRNLERCIDCCICETYCPMNLKITEEEYVQSIDCISCNICVCKCPKPGTLCCEKER